MFLTMRGEEFLISLDSGKLGCFLVKNANFRNEDYSSEKLLFHAINSWNKFGLRVVKNCEITKNLG